MAKRKSSARIPEGSMFIEQIEQQYKDEWVTVEVTVMKKGRPIAGHLIAHGRDEDAVVESDLRYRQEHPDALLYLFYTGEKIPEGWVVLL